ncbi:glycosyltransferase [Ancylobacter sp.]|uniref:glycosyltransferase n=1 Tax=Ancylobacter sp. TaxID=1872567 RepID=UPI003C7BF28B
MEKPPVTPRVSVVMPSYRHEAYIAEAISSVLGQSMTDLELIVVDDASPDGSNAVIRSFDDVRLIHMPLETNIGASAAMNVAVRQAQAPLIAVCNSDDVWEQDKLARQIALLERLPDCAAVFSDVSWIDAAGQPISEPGFVDTTIFTQPNRTRHLWLKRLVEGGNCLCHPSVLLRREVYAECGLYDEYLRQVPDYDLWLRLLQKHPIHVMPDQLVRFRLHGSNTSAQTPAAVERDARERRFIMRRFFEELSVENFNGAFRDGSGREAAPASASDHRVNPPDVWRYLLAYRGPQEDPFGDIALEAVYRAPAELRRSVINALDFHRATGAPGRALPAPPPPPPPPPARPPGFIKRLRRRLGLRKAARQS